MKTISGLLFLVLFMSLSHPLVAQNEAGSAEKLMQHTDSLVRGMQFVFQSRYGQASDEVFVVVDSSYAEVQNGNRNNLEGRLSGWTIKRNEKRKTISISFKIKGVISNADVFILVGEGGQGTATVRQDALAEPDSDLGMQDNRTLNFSFDGRLVDFEHTQIYEGKSHLVR